MRARHELARFDAELHMAGQQLIATEQKLETAQQSMMQQQRLAALGRLAEGVVHERGNAPTAIASFVEVMKTVNRLQPLVKESIEGIGASVEHGRSLPANLDSFRRGRAPAAPMEEGDLNKLMVQIPQLIRPQLERRGGATERKSN